ncbi:MAG: hypothetical protein HY204_07745 [Nitrospirae bacterium]|nr:hypothetical protein [Nitrospirota bacterium]
MRKKRLGSAKEMEPGKSGPRQTVDEMVAELKVIRSVDGLHSLISA